MLLARAPPRRRRRQPVNRGVTTTARRRAVIRIVRVPPWRALALAVAAFVDRTVPVSVTRLGVVRFFARRVILSVGVAPSVSVPTFQQTWPLLWLPPGALTNVKPDGIRAQTTTPFASPGPRLRGLSRTLRTLPEGSVEVLGVSVSVIFGLEAGGVAGVTGVVGVLAVAGGGVTAAAWNVAVTERAWSIVTEHVAALPEQAPLQPTNCWPEPGVAVSVTTVPAV